MIVPDKRKKPLKKAVVMPSRMRGFNDKFLRVRVVPKGRRVHVPPQLAPFPIKEPGTRIEPYLKIALTPVESTITPLGTSFPCLTIPSGRNRP